MNGPHDIAALLRARIFSILVLLLVVGGMVSGSSSAEASRIRARSVVSAQAAPLPTSFTRYLNAGPRVWARVRPDVPANPQLAAAADGTLAASPFVDYLRWRQSLNPARFNRWHPRVAPLLLLPPETIIPVPQLPPPVVPPLIPPTPLVVPPLIPATPQTVVPEPSSWLVGLGMVGAVVLARRFRRVG